MITRDEMLFLFFADLLSCSRVIHADDVSALRALAAAGKSPRLHIEEVNGKDLRFWLEVEPDQDEVFS